MLELAAHYGSGEPLPIRLIAERHDVSARFLVQILLQLKEVGLVASVRGAAGGYLLIKPPRDVSLGQMMEAIGGATKAYTSSASPDSNAAEVLRQTWEKVVSSEREMLDRISLAELLKRTEK